MSIQTYYWDTEKIKQVEGYYFVWVLIDKNKPIDNGVLSWKRCYQVVLNILD